MAKRVSTTDDLINEPADDKQDTWNPAGYPPAHPPAPPADAAANDDDLSELQALLEAIADNKDDDTQVEAITPADWRKS